MNKNIIFSLSLLGIIISSNVFATQATDHASIKALIQKALAKTGTSWHALSIGQAPHQVSDKILSLDYLPQGQSASNWQSMVQYRVIAKAFYANYIKTPTINVAQYVKMAKKTLARRCSVIKWTLLSSAAHKAIYQYQINDCKLWGTQYHVEKIIDKGAYLTSISYTQRAVVNKSDQAKYQALIHSVVIE